MRRADIAPRLPHVIRRWVLLLAIIGGLAVGVESATAHVQVLPSTAPVGTPTEFFVQVPTERTIPTTSVRVMFPSQVTVYSFEVPPKGFTVTPITASNQSIIGVIFRGVIPPGEYERFHFLGTPHATGQTLWPAYQTYADGKIKPWTGAAVAPTVDPPDTGPTDPGPTSAVTITPQTGSGQTSTTVWIALGAGALAVVALILAGLGWSKRPINLPDDDTH
jgi:uncharacterized protein YcnI